MSVHYKFKTAVTFDTICFDGLHISVSELKKSIKQQKKIGKSSDYDLQITDAQTKEVYENDDDLIPKNTSVIVARIPLAQPLKKTNDRSGDRSLYGQDVDSPPQSFDPLTKTADLVNADASEEDKIKAMIGQSGHEYDIGKLRNKMVGSPPPYYSCFRCNQTGHWIKDCPTNNIDIKRSTGIPRSFMIPVEGPNAKGALLTNSGEYAVPLIDHLAYQEVKKERPFYKEQEQIIKPKPEVPQEIQCGICKDPMKDAVLTPCCAENFCDECIRQSLLDSENNECIACHAIDISPNCLVPCRYLRLKVLKYNAQEESFPANSPAEDITKQSPSRKLATSPSSSPLKEAKTDTDEADKENKSPFRNSEDFISDNLKEPGTPLADEPCDEVSNHSSVNEKITCKPSEEETNSISTILTRTNLISYGKGISSTQDANSNYSSKYYERSSSSRYDSHFNKRRSPPRRYPRRSPDRRYHDDHRRDDRSYRGRDRTYDSRTYKTSSTDYKYENAYPHRSNHQPTLPPTHCYPPPQLFESETTIQIPTYPPTALIPVSFPTQPPPPGEAPTSTFSQPPPPGVVPSLPLGIPPPSHNVYLAPHSTPPPDYTSRASSSRVNIDEFLSKPSRTHSYSRPSGGSRMRYRRSKSLSRSRSKSSSYSPSPPRGHSRSRSRSFHRYSRSRSRSHSRPRTLRYSSRKALNRSPPPSYKEHSSHYNSEDEDYNDPEYASYKGRRARYEVSGTKHETYPRYSESSYSKIKSHTSINKGSSGSSRREIPSSVIQLVREVKTEPLKVKAPVEENTIRKVRIVHKESKADKELKKIKVEIKDAAKEIPREDDSNDKIEEPLSSLPHKEKHKHKHTKEEIKKKKKKKKKVDEDTPTGENETSDHKAEKPKKRKSKTKIESQSLKKAKLDDSNQTPETKDPVHKEDNFSTPQDGNNSEHESDKEELILDVPENEPESRDKSDINISLEVEPDSVVLEPSEDLELETDESEKSPTPTHDELHIELPQLSRWERDDYEEEEENIPESSPKLDESKTKEGGLSSEIIKRAEKAILLKPLKAARVSPSSPYKSNETSTKSKEEKYHSPELQVTISNNKDSRSVHPKTTVTINRQIEKRHEESDYKRKSDKKQSQTVTRHVKVEPLREVERSRKRSRSSERIISHESHSKERHSHERNISRERTSRERNVSKERIPHERNFSRERPSSNERNISKEKHSHEKNLSREKLSRDHKSKRHASHHSSSDISKKNDSTKESRSSDSRKHHHHHHSRSHDHRKHARSKSPEAEVKPKRMNRESPTTEQEQSQSSKDESSNDKPPSRDAKSRDKIERRLSTYNESKFEPNYDATSESENEVFRRGDNEEEKSDSEKQASKKQEAIKERLSSVDSAPSSDASSRSSSPASRQVVSPDDLRHRLNKKYKSKKHKKHKSNKHKKKKSSHKLSRKRDS